MRMRALTLTMILLGALPSGAEQPKRLSDHFVLETVSGGVGIFRWKRFDIYELRADGPRVYVGTTPSDLPDRALTSMGLDTSLLVRSVYAISNDGLAVVFRHASGLAGRRSRLKDGIYRYEHGKGIRQLLDAKEMGGTTERHWPRALPANVLVFDPPSPVYSLEDTFWAATAEGEIFPLALLDGGPLHRAAFEGQTDQCAQLIKDGASIDAKTYWGLTALDLAIAQKQDGTAIRLLELGSHPNAGTYPALHHAATIARVEIVRALLDRGADVNALDEWGNSPLHLAVFALRRQFDRNALSAFFRPSNNTVAEEHRVTIPLVRLLLERGAKVDLKDRVGKTPLDYVDRFTPPEIEELLLAHSRQ